MKNFDFIVSSFNGKYLIDIKGKQFPYDPANYWENWISDDDISGLKLWATHFNAFTPLLVYVYDIRFQEDRNKFDDKLKYGGKHYGFVAIELGIYHVNAKSRGKKWDAISVSRERFSKLARPLSSYIPELKRNW